MKIYILALATLLVSIVSCNSNSQSDELSPNEIIEHNVRNYFVMSDSVNLDVQIVDTIFTDELKDMQQNVIKNYNLTQIDVDTLDYVIEVWQNKVFSLQDNQGSELEIANAKLMQLQYELNKSDIETVQLSYSNSKRIFANLERSTQNNISGYEVSAHYKIPEEENTLTLLLDAKFRIVD